jgi:chemotaxis family two-component system sensor kinase Cph1
MPKIMKLYFKRGVMKGFIITLLMISGLTVDAYVCTMKLTVATVVRSRSLLVATNAKRLLNTSGRLIAGELIDNNLNVDVRNLPNASTDGGMMRHVCYNLISNALKYSGKNGNTTVEIGSFPGDKDVCYYVKDNRVGFDMAYADKLFEIFQ